MTTAGHPHDELLDQIKEEFPDILQHTSQGAYIPMDDPRWICNDRLATMIGCASAAELHSLASASPFLDVTIAAESQERVVNAYMNSVNDKVASSIPCYLEEEGWRHTQHRDHLRSDQLRGHSPNDPLRHPDLMS